MTLTSDEDLDITDLIVSSASGVLGEFGLIDGNAARGVAEQVGFNTAAWAGVEEAGFPFALLSEQAGGVGAIHGAAIARIAGATALPIPLVDAMGANWLLDRVGLSPRSGPLSFSGTSAAIEGVADGWRVAGEIPGIAWARACDLVMPCVGKEGAAIALIERGQFNVVEGVNMAEEPRDTVHIDTVLPAGQVRMLDRPEEVELAARLGASLRAVQIAGALSNVLTMTVNHVRERRQFGKPIAAFQAVQQLLAQVATQVSAARCAAELALEHVDRGAPDARASAVAKIRAGEAAGIVAGIAHQLHGAIGFTREHPLHLLTRRLWSWRDEFGGESQWSITLGRDLAANSADGLWAELTGI